MARENEVEAALKAWRDGLVGLTRQSSLIKFRAPKSSSLLIDSPSADEVLERLRTGRSQALRGDFDPDEVSGPSRQRPGTYFHSPRLDVEVGAVARNLMRRSATEFLDRGLSVLYVAFGLLDWRDIDETEMVSPILLVPAHLEPQGPKGTPRIREGEDDPVLNPALTLRLKEFGVDLPTAEDVEGMTVTETLAEVRQSLERNKSFGGWGLRETTHIGIFSFAKEAMFKDLVDNEQMILDHPIVQALATSNPQEQSSEFHFEPVDPADVDRLAPPEVTPLVLDADSSQRVAVAAALAGRSFVMDGPPGTGKSQTIANMIGVLLHAGKSVLFVSEKMAALDVVRNRLAAAGLGSYLLELHSHKASRKEVATELLKTLDNIARPPAAMGTMNRQSVKDRREQLSRYAAAMNEIRQPLNMSLHDVLGMCARLSAARVAPLPESAPTDLSETEYLQIQETVARAVRAWRPAAQGNSFLWRDVVDDQSLEVRLYQAESALEVLRGSASLNARLADAFGFNRPSDAPRLESLIQQWQRHPGVKVTEQWLTASSMQPVQDARSKLGRQIADFNSKSSALHEACGVGWTEFPAPTSVPPEPEPLETTPYPVNLENATAPELNAAADTFEAQAAMLGQILTSLSSLATSLGLPPVRTFVDIDRLTRLIDLRTLNTGPDSRWFSEPALATRRSAMTALRERAAVLDEAEARARSTFTPEALRAPIAELQDRFANLHKGLKKLSGDYRTDKKSVAGLLTNATDVKNGISRLADALQWVVADRAFEDFANSHKDLFASHWDGRRTDLDAVEASLNMVEEVLRLTGNNPPAELVAYLTSPDSNENYQAVADAARSEIDSWKRSLQPAPALAARPELAIDTITQALEWLTAHVAPMRAAGIRAAAVSEIVGTNLTLADANELLALAQSVAEASARLSADEHAYRAVLGDFFNHGASDLASLDVAIGWATALRGLADGPLSPEQIVALTDSDVVDAMEPAYERWIATRDRVIDAFSPGRHQELMAEFDDYDGAAALFDEFRADTVGQQEWFDFQRAYAELAEWGLDAAIDFCIDERVSAGDVAGVVDRALLRAWSDGIIKTDSRLQPLLATEREALVEEYRALDRDLVKAATADIITAVNARRPVNTAIGESGVIRREGGKQRKHRPVRELMAMTRNVTPSIKPVFMMSPLAVSQYLPADMQFDVVIFDEASQVTPGDAINCVYRAKSLILAGDDKQLPPTSFFERNLDDDDEEEETDVRDFQSVLELAKASGAFNNLGLRWHYRSRHEDLIAFSNYKFYDGNLVTFPSAHMEGDDVGVEFFNAHGTYRRGGGANNPIEASKIAERVIDHFTNRPKLTLGVVTFSVAQADAVQSAIDEARGERRDLDRFFDTEDRLDGFFIRALEQVQGDERDVIIFSVGYGPDEAGKISTNFGALNKDKGWRRLNVGITRARQRVEVVASMEAGQIPPSVNENVEYFRSYLDYAEKGQSTLAIPYSSTGLDPESPFEESVIASIRNWGYSVEPQVGAAGYRIDIGVRHPAYPGMFAIGVECDGYQYHSAPAARDRDRLRDKILTELGWRLHRIWGTAWYRDRGTEEARLRAAIEDAINAPREQRAKSAYAAEALHVEIEPAAITTVPTWADEYREAPARSLPHWVDPGAHGNHLHMVEIIESLVEREGPIHIEVAYERLREWWGIGRVGSKIAQNIDRAISRAEVVREGDFLTVDETPVVQVRTPSEVTARKAEQVHLEELALAIALTVRDVGGAPRGEVVQNVARLFGWNRTGAVVDRRMNDAISLLVSKGEVAETAGTLTIAK